MKTELFVLLFMVIAPLGVMAATTTEFQSEDVPKALLDRKTATSDILVTESATVLDVNVLVDITHPKDEDLDVYLIGPDGTEVMLFTDVGGSGDDFSQTILDDDNGTAITSGSAPFSGIYRPEGTLSSFDGKDMAGLWTLRIRDDKTRNTGTLNGWSVNVTYQPTIVEPGITIDPLAGLETSESGQTDSISVVLESQPTSDVVLIVGVDPSYETEVTVSTGTLVFTAGNWNDPQNIVVTGVDDAVQDGSQSYFVDIIVDPFATTDPDYNVLGPFSIDGQNHDNDGDLVFVSSDTPKTIRDGKTTTSTINVNSQVDIIGAFELDVSLTHENMSGLSISLIGPNRTVPLAYDSGSGKWALTDLSGFEGASLPGNWTLSIQDIRDKKDGALNGWTMTVVPFKRNFVFKTTAKGTEIDIFVFRYGRAVQPAIMWVHGGAVLVGHNYNPPDRFENAMLENGYTVLSVAYRLAPNSSLDEAIADVKDGYLWAIANGPQLFNIDPDKVGLWGHSAGAMLSQFAGYYLNPPPAVILSDSGYGDIATEWASTPSQYHLDQGIISEQDAWEGFEPLDVEVIWPTPETHLERIELYTYLRQTGEYPEALTGLDPVLDKATYDDNYCSYLNVTPQYPPTVIIHGTVDMEVPYQQALLLEQALIDNMVDYELITVEGGTHGPDWDLPEEEAQAIVDRAILFINSHLK